MSDDLLRNLLFLLVYIPFAVALLVYIATGGAIGEAAMVEAALLPWWLRLISAPFLLVLVFVGLGRLHLDEWTLIFDSTTNTGWSSVSMRTSWDQSTQWDSKTIA